MINNLFSTKFEETCLLSVLSCKRFMSALKQYNDFAIQYQPRSRGLQFLGLFFDSARMCSRHQQLAWLTLWWERNNDVETATHCDNLSIWRFNCSEESASDSAYNVLSRKRCCCTIHVARKNHREERWHVLLVKDKKKKTSSFSVNCGDLS